VRALWAGAPFVWQLYVQQDGAQRAKLAAFLDLYFAGSDPALASAARSAFARWNGEPAAASLSAIAGAQALTTAWAAHAIARRDAFAAHADLVTRLIAFAEAKR